MISIIAAIGPNRELGKDNKLLWHISEDLKRFKKLTQGHAVIMGRKTFESLGRPLPNRINIVVTRDVEKFKILNPKFQINPKSEIQNPIVCSSLAEAIKNVSCSMLHASCPEVFIIGGGQIYHQGLPLADKLYLTLVEKTPEHPDGKFEADTFFPDYSEFKKVILKEVHEESGYKYTFLELIR